MAKGQITDYEAMDEIACLLGNADEWSSPADFLEYIADIVGLTDRPHPGDWPVNRNYEADLKAARANDR